MSMGRKSFSGRSMNEDRRASVTSEGTEKSSMQRPREAHAHAHVHLGAARHTALSGGKVTEQEGDDDVANGTFILSPLPPLISH